MHKRVLAYTYAKENTSCTCCCQSDIYCPDVWYGVRGATSQGWYKAIAVPCTSLTEKFSSGARCVLSCMQANTYRHYVQYILFVFMYAIALLAWRCAYAWWLIQSPIHLVALHCWNTSPCPMPCWLHQFPRCCHRLRHVKSLEVSKDMIQADCRCLTQSMYMPVKIVGLCDACSRDVDLA